MIRYVLTLGCALLAPMAALAYQASVRVEPPQLMGSREVEKQTQAAVIRDYLQSWKSFRAAFDQNQVALLDPDFVGVAHDKLEQAIEDQAKLGIHTNYQDKSHDLQLVFYSPEGMSLQLIDNVVYDEQVLDHEKVLAVKQVQARYVVVLTPSEVRWKVRVFQSAAE